MKPIRWTSTAQQAYADDPTPVAPLDMAALYQQWTDARDKGLFVARLPLHAAVALVEALATRARTGPTHPRLKNGN